MSKYIFGQDSIQNIITARKSVRTYIDQELSSTERENIIYLFSLLKAPFGPKVRFQLIEQKSSINQQKLGTYGIIKGASNYIGSAVKKGSFDLEALGYQFEQLILLLTAKKLGTCWLGGTFSKSGFAKAMSIQSDEICTAISPVGYPSEKSSIIEAAMKFSCKSSQRKPWEELFFDSDFSTPLAKEHCDGYQQALEMVRLAPSAVNKQPWRIVKDDRYFHFFNASFTSAETEKINLHRVDLGIALCHFDLTCQELNLSGKLTIATPQLNVPANYQYVLSWECN